MDEMRKLLKIMEGAHSDADPREAVANIANIREQLSYYLNQVESLSIELHDQGSALNSVINDLTAAVETLSSVRDQVASMYGVDDEDWDY